LEKKKIVQRIIKGKYLFLLNYYNDYALANYIYQPSYVSLQTAMSFYSLITGFPHIITSITTRKSKTFEVDKREWGYSQIKRDLFWGYKKDKEFLIAEREKALLDYVYFGMKGLCRVDWEEIDLSEINKKRLLSYANKFNNKKILSIIKERVL